MPSTSVSHDDRSGFKLHRRLGNDDFDTDEEIRPRFLGFFLALTAVKHVFLGSTNYTKATLVNGQLVVRDGELLTVDESDLVARAKDWSGRLVS